MTLPAQIDRLRPEGKPMRALRVLKDATGPMHEQDVWHRARRSMLDTSTWHDALKTLVDLGYAERHGNRGGYSWTITAAGIGAVFAKNAERTNAP